VGDYGMLSFLCGQDVQEESEADRFKRKKNSQFTPFKKCQVNLLLQINVIIIIMQRLTRHVSIIRMTTRRRMIMYRLSI